MSYENHRALSIALMAAHPGDGKDVAAAFKRWERDCD